MVQAFGALNKPDKAAEAQEVITDARPTASTFTQLAIFAYQAGQTRKGDLAKNKALELTDPDMREALKGQLEQAKQSAAGSARPPREPSATPVASFYTAHRALVAQLAEQRTLNPKVPGSIPGGGIGRYRAMRDRSVPRLQGGQGSAGVLELAECSAGGGRGDRVMAEARLLEQRRDCRQRLLWRAVLA